ncbi:phosphoribosylglycinamide formyltransferase-1 [Rhizobium sp. SG_E_25_P2]|uniref:phosphoribosylglycinamide formyltransferase n=1 Tax=Rhizobium sp. SG_E_25_P2 TaxID=2879942 RepID=UPI0024748AE8|nr:phosphoribosylglycinamide formyltransferase [Rhizobium sp. SG_E_25_P2]MDH6266749.1 phosphoribosylglycinamide formyltransferase-1 [Rhizobium sp. SG_E_25_P2]
MIKKRGVIFISGSGSNMVALLEAARATEYPVDFVAVISDKADAGGLAKAEALGVATHVFERKGFGSKAEHEAAILARLAEIAPDLICLAGYMRLLSADFIAAYEGRILNIHPSLLPLFPGLHTHQRAIEAGMKVSGCTVHIVTPGMDEGPALAQGVAPILAGDTPDALAARVLKVEHQIYKAAVARFAGGAVETDADARLVSFG